MTERLPNTKARERLLNMKATCTVSSSFCFPRFLFDLRPKEGGADLLDYVVNKDAFDVDSEGYLKVLLVFVFW